LAGTPALRSGSWGCTAHALEIIKYEAVYLHAYASVSEASASIGRYIDFYNSIRPHSSLQALTPDRVYFNRLSESLAA
jgi:putative transposase